MLQIQQMLPRARVVYCSATGVSEVGNMAYMTRLGLWGSGRAWIYRKSTGQISVVNYSVYLVRAMVHFSSPFFFFFWALRSM